MPKSVMTTTDSKRSGEQQFNVEKYVRQYAEQSSSLVESPVHLERLKFLIKTIVSEYNNNNNQNNNDVVDPKTVEKIQDSSHEQDTLLLLYKTLEQTLIQVGNMKVYLEFFQTSEASTQQQSQQQQQQLYFKEKPLPQSLGIHFNQELYQHTVNSQANKATTLKANLSTAQHLISKESIRIAHLHLAHFYTQTGSYDEAMSHLRQVKEYSNTGTQLMEVTLLMAELGLAMGKFSFVQSLYDTSIHHHHPPPTSMSMPTFGSNSNMEESELSFRYKLNIARGIAYMAQGYYKEAYSSFTSISPYNHQHTNGTTSFLFLVSAQDIAMYTGLMALMVLNRKEMEDCMSKTVFKSRFDSMIGLKDALMYYSRANYGDCMNALYTMYSSMTHDLFLKQQVGALWKKLKGKCLVQYFQPYISVSLETVRDLFVFQSTEEVEDVVSDLIESGELKNVKIDGLNQTLVGMNSHDLERRKKRNMMKRLVTLGDSVLYDVENTVTRLTCMEYGIIVPANRRGGWKGTSTSGTTRRRRDWAGAMRHRDDGDSRISEEEDQYANEYYEEEGTGREDSNRELLLMEMDPVDDNY